MENKNFDGLSEDEINQIKELGTEAIKNYEQALKDFHDLGLSINDFKIKTSDIKMRKQELRIGINLFDTVRGVFVLIDKKHFRELAVSEERFFQRYVPIKISHEVLIDMGYMKQGEHYNLNLHCIWKCSDIFICDKNGTVLKYVHQLQNLLFFTKGVELIIV